MNEPMIVLIDGENLILRFQEMLAEGRKIKPDVIYV